MNTDHGRAQHAVCSVIAFVYVESLRTGVLLVSLSRICTVQLQRQFG